MIINIQMQNATLLLLCFLVALVLTNPDAQNPLVEDETADSSNCTWYSDSTGESYSSCSNSSKKPDSAENNVEDEFIKLAKESKRYQEDYCKNIKDHEDPKIEMKYLEISFRDNRFNMYTHPISDVVSWHIVRYGIWSNDETNQVLNALEFYQERNNIVDPKQIMFLDIGGQIGWFTLNVAYRGYKVITFEPMYLSEYILRHNLCLNTSLDVTLFNTGLYERDTSCNIFSEEYNTGNAALNCSSDNDTSGTYNRGAAKLVKLDHFRALFKNLAVVKIDIEGCEFHALRGGRSVFLDMHVPFITTEVNLEQLKSFNSDPVEYIKTFMNSGYKPSIKGFRSSELLNENDLVSLFDMETNPKLIVDIFMTHESYYD